MPGQKGGRTDEGMDRLYFIGPFWLSPEVQKRILFSYELCKIFKNTFFTEHILESASGNSQSSFFSFPYSLVLHKRTGKIFFCQYFSNCYPCVWLLSLDTLANSFVRVVCCKISCICAHDIPWALEINSNGGIKQAWGILLLNHWKHYISTNKVPVTIKRDRVVT